MQLLETIHNTLFPDTEVNWGQIVVTLVKTKAPLVCIKNALGTQETAFPEHEVNWEEAVMGLAKEKSEFYDSLCQPKGFLCLLRHSVASRLNVLGVEKWQEEIESDLDNFLVRFPQCVDLKRRYLESLYSKLSTYERVKEAAWVLELALWKARMIEQQGAEINNGSLFRHQCHINSGADVVVPNVLPFLLPAREMQSYMLSHDDLGCIGRS